MGITLWCIAVVCAVPFLVGVPIQRLLNRGRPLDESTWLQVPFVGLAVVVLVSQNLVYLDWRSGKSACLLWVLVLAGWLALAVWRVLGRRGGGAPVGVFAAALAVYLFHGMGLLWVGARFYAGHGWWDEWNYVCLAQFFQDARFSTTLDHLGHQAVFGYPLLLKGDRIGQSVLHAFFAASTFQDAKTLFEPTILLGPALTVVAVHALARRLGLAPSRALAAGAAAALLPGVGTLHLDSFLSQSLATPFLFLLPTALDDLHRRPGWAALFRAALLLAAIVSMYTEYLAMLAGCLALGLLLLLVCGALSRRLTAWYAGLVVTALALNPGFLPLMPLIALRATAAGSCADTYPWAMTLEGWGRVWLGDMAADASPAWASLVRLYALGVPALAYLGLLRAWRGWRLAAAWGAEARRRFVVLSLTAGLTLLPLAVAVRDADHPYQFYKLLLAVSPLLVLGLVLPAAPNPWAVGETGPAAEGPGGRRPAVAFLTLAPVLLLGAAGTGRMVLDTAGDSPRPRSFMHILHGADMRYLQNRLKAAPAGDLVLALHHPFLDSWTTYLGRKHRAWLYEPSYLHPSLIVPMQISGVLYTADLPAGAMVLTRDQDDFAAVRPGDVRLAWSSPDLRLWQARSKHWALPVVFTAPHGAGTLAGVPCCRLGPQPTAIEMLAGGPGQLTLRGVFVPEGGAPPGAARRVRVATSGGARLEFATTGDPQTITIPLDAGKTVVTLTVPAEAEGAAAGTLLMNGLSLEFTAGE